MPDAGRDSEDAGNQRRSSSERASEQERGRSNRAFRELGPIFGLGIQLAASIAVMFFIGRWLDERWGTAPWMMLTGTAFGAAAGMYNFIKTVTGVTKKENKEDTSAS